MTHVKSGAPSCNLCINRVPGCGLRTASNLLRILDAGPGGSIAPTAIHCDID